MADDKVFELIEKEEERQRSQVQLIPSENFVSEAVKRAIGSGLTNKYAEGYPGKRYYQGNKVIDEIENLAIERGKRLLGVEHLNVQPYSGSPANAAVYMALLEPGEKICGMKLSAGGHLTHGHPKITFSGKYFTSVQYDVEPDGRIDYEKLDEMVAREKPKLIVVGTTAYPFRLDFERFGKIAKKAGAWLVADISHIIGLIVAGVHPSPVDYCDVITSTTHKTLRGPRGAIIGVTKKGVSFAKGFGILNLGERIDKAVFPGLQGGPHENTIAALAVVFAEAETDEFKEYGGKVVRNAAILAETLRKRGYRVFGTENHLMVVEIGEGSGKQAAEELEEAGIIVNANTIPHDTAGPFRPSGIRIGSPAMTTLGFGEKEFEKTGEWIDRVLRKSEKEKVAGEVKEFLEKFSKDN